MCDRHLNDVVSNSLQLFGAGPTGDDDQRSLARFDLLDVIEIFREHCVIWRDKDRRKLRPNQRDDSMFELSAGMAFGIEIGDLFHLKRALQSDREVELATEKQHARYIGILLYNLFNVVAQLKNFFDLIRQRFERFHDTAALGSGHVTHPSEQ